MSQRVENGVTVGDPPPGRLLRLFPAMGSSEYRKLFYAAGLSAISLWGLILTRGWLAGELADSGWAVGVVYFAAIGPWVLAPIGGALADRFDRARVVMICRAGAALMAALLAVLAFNNSLALWSLILITAVSGIIRSAEMPAQAALLPNTVKAYALLSAITLASMMQFGSRVIGPVAGPALKEFGAGWVFVGAVVLLLLSIWQMRRITVRSTGGIQAMGTGLGGVLRDARHHVHDGLRYLGKAPGVRMLIALTAAHCMLAMSFDALLVVFAKGVLGGDETEFAYLVMGVGGGALVATVALSMVPGGPVRGRLMLIAGIISGISLPILGLAQTLPVAVIGSAIAGSSQAMFMALSSVMIQQVVPDSVRGRVMSLYAMFAGGIMAAMILANGLASDFVSVRYLLTIPGILFSFALIVWFMIMPRLRSTMRHGELVEESVVARAAAAAATAATAVINTVAARSAPQRTTAASYRSGIYSPDKTGE